MRVEDQPAGEKWIRMTREEMCQWKGKGLIKGGGGGLIKMMAVPATAKASLPQPFATNSCASPFHTCALTLEVYPEGLCM